MPTRSVGIKRQVSQAKINTAAMIRPQVTKIVIKVSMR